MFIMKKRTKDMPLFPLSHTLIGAAALTVMLIITVIYGQVRLREERPGIPVTASIVQGNIEQDKKWETAYQHTVMETYKDLSLKAVSANPSMIIWPETAVPFMFNADKYYTEELTDFQKPARQISPFRKRPDQGENRRTLSAFKQRCDAR